MILSKSVKNNQLLVKVLGTLWAQKTNLKLMEEIWCIPSNLHMQTR